MADTQDKLGRVRPPRVHIRFDVETGGAEPKNDLPFVVGVMGDFSGDQIGTPQTLSERRFVEINRDNFNSVMASMNPGIENLKVPNTLAGDGSDLVIESLRFNSINDFNPDNLIDKVEPLKRLMAIRNRLSDLMSKADRSPALAAILERVLRNEEGALNELASELGVEPTPSESSE